MDSACSYARIAKSDLRRLARIAREDRNDFFERHPEYALLYRKRLLCAALAGGAALHYLNGITGVSEFHVWSFYAQHAEAPFPAHLVSHADYGESKFGRAPGLPETYRGRRVVLEGRSLDALPGDDPLDSLQRYLRAGATPTARELAAKAVVLLEPPALLGIEAWPSLVLPPRR
jgi:hypothetical protein